jgi:hypothetical protein
MTKRLSTWSCLTLCLAACGSQEAAPAAEETALPESTQGAEAPPAAEAAPAAEPATPAAQAEAPKMPEPTGGVVVLAKVKDYDAWRAAFDQGESFRREGGFIGQGVMREVGNAKSVGVWLPTTDLEKAKAFTENPDLKKRMKESGVIGLPAIRMLSLVENQPTQDPAAKYGAFVEHKVKDYDAWKPVFDEHATMRAGASIVGHAVAQDPANAKQVYVWVQATDLAKLQAFIASKDLKTAMKNAGVRGAPKITVVEVIDRKMYQ